MTSRGSCSPARSPTICCRPRSDFPNLRAFVMDEHPSPINPLGAKGAGEGGMVGAGGAIANAVANALQSFKPDLRELPLTPTRVWEMARKR